MTAGDLYHPGDAELTAESLRSQQLLRQYNDTTRADAAERERLLNGLGITRGTGCALRVPFHVDYGFNITLGDGVFMNFGGVILDVCPVVIGDRTQIGPYVQILTADHPRDAATRETGAEFGRPITIGADVWIGGGAILLPGITVGDGAIIGAGAVVTRDVAPHATVVGNPARPIEKSATDA